jgi:predicted transcriptional regulator
MQREEEKVTGDQFMVRVPGELGEALRQRAHDEDRPISRVIRSALKDYLQPQEVMPAQT